MNDYDGILSKCNSSNKIGTTQAEIVSIYIHMYTRAIRLHQFILQICFMGQRGCCLPNHQEYYWSYTTGSNRCIHVISSKYSLLLKSSVLQSVDCRTCLYLCSGRSFWGWCVWACLGDVSGLVLGVLQQEFVSMSAMVDKFRPPV